MVEALAHQHLSEADHFAHSRHKLVNKLKSMGIRNQKVLDVMASVPRHVFVEAQLSHLAYKNQSLPIGSEQTISQPYVVARMTEMLIEDGYDDKVLEIGTGSGYQTAVLAKMFTGVFTVERMDSLFRNARRVLREQAFSNVHFLKANGARGWNQYAPYQAIMITAAVEREVPRLILEQMAIPSLLVAPIGGEYQHLAIIRRSHSGWREKRYEKVKFVPFVDD